LLQASAHSWCHSCFTAHPLRPPARTTTTEATPQRRPLQHPRPQPPRPQDPRRQAIPGEERRPQQHAMRQSLMTLTMVAIPHPPNLTPTETIMQTHKRETAPKATPMGIGRTSSTRRLASSRTWAATTPPSSHTIPPTQTTTQSTLTAMTTTQAALAEPIHPAQKQILTKTTR